MPAHEKVLHEKIFQRGRANKQGHVPSHPSKTGYRRSALPFRQALDRRTKPTKSLTDEKTGRACTINAPIRSMSLDGRRSNASPFFSALADIREPLAAPAAPRRVPGRIAKGGKVGEERWRPRRRTVTAGALAPCGRETAAVDSESLRDDAEEAEMP